MTQRSIPCGVLGLFALVSAVGCGHLEAGAARAPRMQGSGEFRAGAATVDVTPPALLGTWGHGPGAAQSRGHRGRLRCGVVYLEDARG